jgi:beclin 1
LKAAELELSNLQSEIARLEAESTTLNAQEVAFWRSRNAFSLSLEEFQNERDEVNIKYDHDAKLLERLQRTNVYNDAFCITHDGFFGVINGLRLGRLPNKQVSTLPILLFIFFFSDPTPPFSCHPLSPFFNPHLRFSH